MTISSRQLRLRRGPRRRHAAARRSCPPGHASRPHAARLRGRLRCIRSPAWIISAAMLAVGVWSAGSQRRAWIAPAAFVACLLAGRAGDVGRRRRAGRRGDDRGVAAGARPAAGRCAPCSRRRPPRPSSAASPSSMARRTAWSWAPARRWPAWCWRPRCCTPPASRSASRCAGAAPGDARCRRGPVGLRTGAAGGAGVMAGAVVPGELIVDGPRPRAQPRPAPRDAGRRERRRPPDPGRLALPLRRDQRARCASTATPRAACGSTSPSGTAVRFEPGEQRTVHARRPRRRAHRLRLPRPRARDRSDAARIGRRAYAEMFGPTTGDRVRLADTDLVIEVEQDFTRRYGEEVKFGGGKVDPRRHGPGPGVDGPAPADAVDLRHHQRADRRPLGHRQGRHRHPRRPHRRPSARPATRDVQPGVDHRDRRRHRGHRRRGPDRHRRRHRHPHPLHLPAAGRGGARQRRHDDDRRRHRPGHRHQRHHLHARRRGNIERMLQAADALPDQPRLPRQGQRQPARGAAPSRSRPARAA